MLLRCMSRIAGKAVLNLPLEIDAGIGIRRRYWVDVALSRPR